MGNKQVNVYRIYKKRPARITIVVPADLHDYESVQIKPEMVLKVEYLDDVFEDTFRNNKQRKFIKSEISHVKVKRLPRKEKKRLKFSIGIPNRKGRICLVAAMLFKTETGFDIQIRRK